MGYNLFTNFKTEDEIVHPNKVAIKIDKVRGWKSILIEEAYSKISLAFVRLKFSREFWKIGLVSKIDQKYIIRIWVAGGTVISGLSRQQL